MKGDAAAAIRANPEIHSVWRRAIREEWSPARFERALIRSNWYRSKVGRRRQILAWLATWRRHPSPDVTASIHGDGP